MSLTLLFSGLCPAFHHVEICVILLLCGILVCFFNDLKSGQRLRQRCLCLTIVGTANAKTLAVRRDCRSRLGMNFPAERCNF